MRVAPTLRRQADDVQSLMALLGQLHCMAQPTRLADWYKKQAGYRMLTDLPRHPLLRESKPDVKRLRFNTRLTFKGHYEEEVKVSR